MKVLVLSLLRMGDFIMHQEVVKAYKQKYPEAEIHYLINDSFAHLSEIANEKLHLYPRENLKKIIRDPCYHSATPFVKILNLIHELNQQQYDVILNLTHNIASAYVSGMINAKTKLGLTEKNGQIVGLNNPWLRYFNSNFSERNKEVFPFHYIDILAKSFDLSISESTKVVPRSGKILIQPLTGDKKKDWGLHNFACLTRKLKRDYPHLETKVICAPFEFEKIKTFFDDKDILVLNLKSLKSELEQAQLLITGDTFVKHLAAQSGTQIIELALGSSDPFRTGAYIEGSIIIHPEIHCAPCSHTQSCSQLSQICASQISLEILFPVIQKVLSESDTFSSKHFQLLENIYSNISIYVTQFDPVNGWTLNSGQQLKSRQRVYQTLSYNLGAKNEQRIE